MIHVMQWQEQEETSLCKTFWVVKENMPELPPHPRPYRAADKYS